MKTIHRAVSSPAPSISNSASSSMHSDQSMDWGESDGDGIELPGIELPGDSPQYVRSLPSCSLQSLSLFCCCCVTLAQDFLLAMYTTAHFYLFFFCFPSISELRGRQRAGVVPVVVPALVLGHFPLIKMTIPTETRRKSKSRKSKNRCIHLLRNLKIFRHRPFQIIRHRKSSSQWKGKWKR